MPKIDGDKVIEFIEKRKKQYPAPHVWHEFTILRELNEVKRFVEKMQTEEDNEG